MTDLILIDLQLLNEFFINAHECGGYIKLEDFPTGHYITRYKDDGDEIIRMDQIEFKKVVLE